MFFSLNPENKCQWLSIYKFYTKLVQNHKRLFLTGGSKFNDQLNNAKALCVVK
jgi:hypothetical protein